MFIYVAVLVFASTAFAQTFDDKLYSTKFTLVLNYTGDDPMPEAPYNETKEWLNEDVFADVIGFEDVTVHKLNASEWDNETIVYTVDFGLQTLSDNASFVDGSWFLEQLEQCQQFIEDEDQTWNSFEVNAVKTASAMENEREDMIALFSDRSAMCEDRNDFCSDMEKTCDVVDGEFVCSPKCKIFRERNERCEANPRLDLIYVKGKCVLDANGDPYCDCGSSVGGILDNFYDGNECVSAAFIVGMATVGAGFFILVLLGVVIGLAVTNCNKSDTIKSLENDAESREVRTHSPSEAFPPKDDDDENDLVGMNDIEMTKTPSESEKRSYNPNIYTNQGFDQSEEKDEKPTNHSATNGVKPPSDPSEQPSYSADYNMYEDLAPRLSHIDPAADYSIKRPTVTLRPTDAYTNDRGYSRDYSESANL